MTYLLDINVLLALADPQHLHHAAAHSWFAATGQDSWATCPITENGFVRIASNPKYGNSPGDSPTVLNILVEFCKLDGHTFWSDNLSIRDLIPSGTLFSPSQITDLYLIGLAVHHGGRLATFDNRIPHSLIQHGSSAIELLAA